MDSLRLTREMIPSNHDVFAFKPVVPEKATATHPTVLAWRIPGMGEPGGLPSMGSHGHEWSNLAAAVVLKMGILGQPIAELTVVPVFDKPTKLNQSCIFKKVYLRKFNLLWGTEFQWGCQRIMKTLWKISCGDRRILPGQVSLNIITRKLAIFKKIGI